MLCNSSDIWIFCINVFFANRFTIFRWWHVTVFFRILKIIIICFFDFFFLFCHYRFTAAEPGVVYCRQFADTAETRHVVLKPGASPPRILPPSLPAPGLSAERQQYLYDKIRPFCRPDARDTTCPRPQDVRALRWKSTCIESLTIFVDLNIFHWFVFILTLPMTVRIIIRI